MPLALAVHGGACNIPDDAVEPAEVGVRAALERGWSDLRRGASSLDVVEQVVRVFNTPRMARGWASESEGIHALVDREGKSP